MGRLGKGEDWHGDQDRRFRLHVDVLIPSSSSRALTLSSVAESQVKKKVAERALCTAAHLLRNRESRLARLLAAH